MNMNTKKIGNDAEELVCKLFAKNGYWVHRLVSNAAGQPGDIIAINPANHCAVLIEVKHISNNRFDKNRIEPNQWLALTDFKTYGVVQFAFVTTSEIIVISFDDFMIGTHSNRTVTVDKLKELGIIYEIDS